MNINFCVIARKRKEKNAKLMKSMSFMAWQKKEGMNGNFKNGSRWINKIS